MKHLLSSITLLLLSTLAFGQVPNTFSSGETISSSKINANFAYVASAIKNDNITAMMVCSLSGYSGNDFYYSRCFSTNDQEFETVTLNSIFINMENSTTRSDAFNIQNSGDSINLKNLFNNKWILYDSKSSMTSYHDGHDDEQRLVHYQKHIFYKVASD